MIYPNVLCSCSATVAQSPCAHIPLLLSLEQEQLQQQALEQMKQLLGMEHILQSQKIVFAEDQRPRNQPSHQRRRR